MPSEPGATWYLSKEINKPFWVNTILSKFSCLGVVPSLINVLFPCEYFLCNFVREISDNVNTRFRRHCWNTCTV
jgi:hypothetical protein